MARSADRVWQSAERKDYCNKEVTLRVSYAPVSALISNPKNWAMQAGDMYGRRYSPLNQINRRTVTTMKVAWTFSTGVLRGHEGGPIVIGNTLYVHTPFPNKVFAIDLESQRIKWKYEAKQVAGAGVPACCDSGAGGVAYAEGKIFLQQADMTLVALDADTGAVIWWVRTGDPKFGQSSVNAPHVFKDKVITGIAGDDFGIRGFIAAYSVEDGALVWKGYSTGPDSEMLIDPVETLTYANGRMEPVGPDSSLKSWAGEEWKLGGGTTPGAYSFDPELNLLYYGSGSPSYWNPAQRSIDHKWTASIWARDIDTGRVKWIYQTTPNNNWGFSAATEMLLADIPVKGVQRKALVHFDTNGFAYTLDRVTGELLVADKYNSSANWATRIDLTSGRPQLEKQYATVPKDVNVPTIGVCPAMTDSKGQQPSAFDAENGLFYVPTSAVCMDYEPFVVEYTAGQPYVGATLSMYPAPRNRNKAGGFLAWDAGLGKLVGARQESFEVRSGALVTAGGIACYGTLEGYLKCVDAADVSKELFSFKTPSGIVGNVNTWEYRGKQYIGVLSGIGGEPGVGTTAVPEKDKELSAYTQLGGQLTVFALPD
ncbi:PQQ-dependent dehydrogenase, methanol/ethanol family [Azohydromonas sp. G-1-1-14]|uniref:PQQ-dependent dehydrogenase, methanol/ethanol family n=2 Tax=Azohydromonas caseinilytica TaxID=2728836 RepID=A0A848FBM9_9BURK|nr:PQQ-dependent dehydrogenase, methanol/ethanol family [Azohydromonas caseinilytica]